MKSRRKSPRFSTAALFAALTLVTACRTYPPFTYDFERAASLDDLGWTCRALFRLSPAHATSGSSSLEMTLYPAPPDVGDSYPGLSLTGFDPDWSEFHVLVFDAHNPGDRTLGIGVRLDDRREADGNDWFWSAIQLAPGDNRVVVPLADLRTKSGRTLRLQHVIGLTIYVANPVAKRTVYLDNLRLE